MWFSVDPSIFVTRPPRTVTSSVHASGQSSGQAVVTVDSGGATPGFGMHDYLRIEEMARLPQVIIIGGGFAGLAAARRLRKVACEVTIVDRHNHHVFQPLLYQVATAGLSPGDIASPIRWILRQAAASARAARQRRAHRFAPRKQRSTLDQAATTLAYDYLIVAAGATHSYFGHDEWADAAPGLKTLDDALAIRRRLLLAFEEAEREPNPVYQRRLLTFVLIGGGPTGVEMAGALGEIARQALRAEFDAVDPAIARIILIEAGPSILPAFPEDLRESARRALLRLGVDVRVGKAGHQGRRRRGVDRRRAHRGAHDPVGRRAWRPRRCRAISARGSIAPAASSSSPTCRCRDIRRSSSPATSRRSRIRPASRCPASRRSPSSRARTLPRTSRG